MPTRTLAVTISKCDYGRFDLTVEGQLSDVTINEENLSAQTTEDMIIRAVRKAIKSLGGKW